MLGTADWLHTFPAIHAGLNHFKPWYVVDARLLASACVIFAVIGLVALAIWPKSLYSLLWLLPILLVIGLQSWTEKPVLVRDIEVGDWRRVWILAVSGLICGLFWEMWNAGSLAHWSYSIPYAQRFMIFEMPVLGYAGYLPFGLECAVIGELIDWSGPAEPEDR